ncbi:MAG: hypothetical protein IRY88_09660 [Rubrobacteraceae bacterium]|nr:hypothetical protein [Rubrobacteraceae bacterium]
MDFDTSKNGSGREPRHRLGGTPSFSTATRTDSSKPAPEDGDFRIPAGSRKAALVHLALEAWRKGLLDPKELGEVRGRDVDEAGLQRALYRSSMGEIEHLLGPVVKGKRIVVEGHLAGTGRTAMERLGAEVEELRLEDEKRYIDMTPVIFVVAAVAMAVRYVSLGLDDQSLYILAGIAFALMYGLRPFFYRMQRPRDE